MLHIYVSVVVCSLTGLIWLIFSLILLKEAESPVEHWHAKEGLSKGAAGSELREAHPVQALLPEGQRHRGRPGRAEASVRSGCALRHPCKYLTACRRSTCSSTRIPGAQLDFHLHHYILKPSQFF